MLGVVPSASARSLAPRFGLVLVTASSLKGGPDVRIGPDMLVDRWGLSAPLQIRGSQALHGLCLVGRGLIPWASYPFIVGLRCGTFCVLYHSLLQEDTKPLAHSSSLRG
jgi:hypothetical protein